jgi:hypothetical protein
MARSGFEEEAVMRNQIAIAALAVVLGGLEPVFRRPGPMLAMSEPRLAVRPS